MKIWILEFVFRIRIIFNATIFKNAFFIDKSFLYIRFLPSSYKHQLFSLILIEKIDSIFWPNLIFVEDYF